MFPLSKIKKEYHGITTLSKEQLQKAKDRLRAFERRDEEKMKTDKAKNDFESVIYSMREWLTDDENNAYVQSSESDELMTRLSQEEDWLLEGEGDKASHQEYSKRYNELNSKLQNYKSRKTEHRGRDDAVQVAKQKLNKIED